MPSFQLEHIFYHTNDFDVQIAGYSAAFNSAWEHYKDPEDRRGDSSREETAHRVAWAAVKNEYEKDDSTGEWKRK